MRTRLRLTLIVLKVVAAPQQSRAWVTLPCLYPWAVLQISRVSWNFSVRIVSTVEDLLWVVPKPRIITRPYKYHRVPLATIPATLNNPALTRIGSVSNTGTSPVSLHAQLPYFISKTPRLLFFYGPPRRKCLVAELIESIITVLDLLL